ncbi:MAG: squalene--hopene cyclase [Planctomycetales bacterium]
MRFRKVAAGLLVASVVWGSSAPLRAEGEWETTTDSEAALERGLQWLAANQGPQGNWGSDDLGLVSLGALAFLSAGHTPGHGKYGAAVDKALNYVVTNAKPSGLLNISNPRRDMYNHGLAAFVLGQAYGMTNDRRLGVVLERALALISQTQCDDGGWDYVARRQARGHDLSLVVMQAKALRSAMDSGLAVSPAVTALAIKSVRDHYRSKSGNRNVDDPAVQAEPGQFTYDGNRTSLAMAACGVVCLQEFGEYGDWRIAKNLEVIQGAVRHLDNLPRNGRVPHGAYAAYYIGQALYQVGGEPWKTSYPKLRNALVATQALAPGNPQQDGAWEDAVHVSGQAGKLYGTAVGCFLLAIPNRYLPILQEGKIDSLKGRMPSGERS